MKKICFIAQFPPPMHGLAKAVETLYNSELQQEFEIEKVDITNNKNFLKNLQLISKSKADLFYFTISQTKGGNLRDLVIFKLLRMQHKKCLIHLHGGYYRQLVDNDMASWQRKANYKTISQLEGSIVLGESLKQIFKEMLPDEKIFVVPNCVDDDFYMLDADFEKKISTVSEREIKHVLYLSNFIGSKGYPIVLELARLEKENCQSGKDRTLHFDFAGKFFDEEEQTYFSNYIKENSLEEYITYHGIVGGQEKKDILKNCDFFALPTRYPNEGQPISILEAMGNGMVIITTDHAGIPDVVVDGQNGIVLSGNNFNSGALYSQILELTDADMMRISQINREQIQARYKQNMYIQNMRVVLRRNLYA